MGITIMGETATTAFAFEHTIPLSTLMSKIPFSCARRGLSRRRTAWKKSKNKVTTRRFVSPAQTTSPRGLYSTVCSHPAMSLANHCSNNINAKHRNPKPKNTVLLLQLLRMNRNTFLYCKRWDPRKIRFIYACMPR